MSYAILVQLILQKGVDQVTVPDPMRLQVWTEAGTLLFKEQRYEESGKAFAKAGNSKEMLSAAAWLTQQARHKDAAYFLIHTWERDKMEACASACMNQGHMKEAHMLYEALGNKEMLAFLQGNFA